VNFLSIQPLLVLSTKLLGRFVVVQLIVNVDKQIVIYVGVDLYEKQWGLHPFTSPPSFCLSPFHPLPPLPSPIRRCYSRKILNYYFAVGIVRVFNAKLCFLIKGFVVRRIRKRATGINMKQCVLCTTLTLVELDDMKY